jgi:hypothetical protein
MNQELFERLVKAVFSDARFAWWDRTDGIGADDGAPVVPGLSVRIRVSYQMLVFVFAPERMNGCAELAVVHAKRAVGMFADTLFTQELARYEGEKIRG